MEADGCIENQKKKILLLANLWNKSISISRVIYHNYEPYLMFHWYFFFFHFFRFMLASTTSFQTTDTYSTLPLYFCECVTLCKKKSPKSLVWSTWVKRKWCGWGHMKLVSNVSPVRVSNGSHMGRIARKVTLYDVRIKLFDEANTAKTVLDTFPLKATRFGSLLSLLPLITQVSRYFWF